MSMERQHTLTMLTAILFLGWLADPTSCWHEKGKVIGIFDNETFSNMFSDVMLRNLSMYENEALTIGNETAMTEYLCSETDILFIYAVLSVSPSLHINMLSSIAVVRNIPVFVYDTTADTHPNGHMRWVEGDLLYYMNSKKGDEGLAIADMIIDYNFAHVDVLVQSKYQFDGFRSTIKDVFIKNHDGEMIDIVFTKNDSINNLLIQLQSAILTKEIKGKVASPLMDKHYVSSEVVVVHCDSRISHELLKGAELLFHDKQIIWVLSVEARGDTELLQLINSDIITVSLLPVDEHLIEDSLMFITNKFESIKHEVAQEGLVNSLNCDKPVTNPKKILTWQRLIEESGLTVNGNFHYYRYDVSFKAHRDDHWTEIGQIDPLNSHHGSSLLEYLDVTVKKKQMFTVVTVFDKPFSVEASPLSFDGGDYCPTPSVPCLKIAQSVIISHGYSSDIVQQVFEDYYSDIQNPDRPFTKTCCEGLCIDLLKSLSSELQFDYQLYIVPDGEWGAYDPDKGNWSGLVKELLDDRADMVLASFSITSVRSAVIGYSAPFYHSGFSLMAINKKDTDTKWFSYLDPYPLSAWAMIIAFACATFLVLGLFEWWSPHGLNSTHDKKASAYTLGTAIKTVFSLMSGNTVPTKSPMSWPGRWMQNVWGFFSIIYLAIYTATLTSSIADSMSIHSFKNIYDERLLRMEVAAPTNGAIEQYVKLIRPQLYEEIRKHKIKTISDGIEKLRDGSLDVWMHDTPVIDYIITSENNDCSLEKVLTFAVDSYGIGFPRTGLDDIKNSINSKVLQYQMAGYMDRLHKYYFVSSKECQDPIGDAEQIKLNLKNAAGLFLTLMGFIVLCFLLIGAEHLVYRFVIPHGKRQPPGSLWRGNALMFFSQRMYRAIEKDGGNGRSVFVEFMKKLQHLKQFLTMDQLVKNRNTAKLILKLSIQREQDRKMTFYEVVTQIYEREKKKPLSSIFQTKEKKSRKKMFVRNGLKEAMSIMTAVPFAGSPSMIRSLESLKPPEAVLGRASGDGNDHQERDIQPVPLPILRRLRMDDSFSLQNSFCSNQTETTFMSESLDVPGEHSSDGEMSHSRTINTIFL